MTYADMTREELTLVIGIVVLVLLLVAALYGFFMMRLLRREADRANKAAKIAEEHAQAKTRFLAMMSHELRTPLNAVIGFAEFLSREGLDENRRNEYTDGILLSATALLELINDILDLSKLEAGAMKMRSGACDMRQLLGELPAIFGYRVRKHGVKLNIEMPPAREMPVVELAQQGMREAFRALMQPLTDAKHPFQLVLNVYPSEEDALMRIDPGALSRFDRIALEDYNGSLDVSAARQTAEL